MKKKVLHDYDLRKGKLMAETETATVIRLNNGSVLKLFRPDILQHSTIVNMEQKILDAVPIKHSPEILVPTAAVYSEQGNFAGYIMPSASGQSYNDLDDSLSIPQRENLTKYAHTHAKLEKVLKRNKDIVFPDFCTCDNIFIDNNGNVQFIDYDGLQIGGHRSLSVSTSLGMPEQILSPKYINSDCFFSKELDKRSSIILYFLSTFNMDVTKIGMVNPETGLPVTFDDFFSCIELDDPDVCHKVWKLFQDDQPNEYLGDDVYRIADKYDMKVVAVVGDKYIKKLYKK